MYHNEDIISGSIFIELYMDENVIYHTKECSFMWTTKDNLCITYFMDIYNLENAFRIEYYTIEMLEVKDYKAEVVQDFDQASAFADYLSSRQ